MHHYLQVPNSLRTVAQYVASALSADEAHAPMGARSCQISGELLSFPYRVYYKKDVISAISHNFQGEAKELALCLASRHHDGRVREYSIRSSCLLKSSLVIPFSVQLLGEYVAEIGKAIEEQIAILGLQKFIDFAKENPKLIETIRRRSISYWDCYYRNDYVNLSDYPCYRAIQSIISASRE